MSDTRSTNWFLVIFSVFLVPAGSFFLGLYGYEELGPIGAVIGGLAGGFLGLVSAWLLCVVITLSFLAVIFLGPIALVVAILYFAFVAEG